MIGNPDLAASDIVPGQYEGAPHVNNARMQHIARCLRRRTLSVMPSWRRLCAGGLKLWESSVDLANILVDRFWSPIADHGSRRQGMRGMRVMELGCGHGLPGIVCALAGAQVCFQVLARADVHTCHGKKPLHLIARTRCTRSRVQVHVFVLHRTTTHRR